MKLKRHKKLERYLSFFCNNFGFYKPFQVLVDGTFCFSALKNKCNIKDQIPKYFNGEVKFLTTPCVILETERLGPKIYGAMVILKQFAFHKCGHENSPVLGSECILSMLEENNKHRYIVATQDRNLQKSARQIPGTPILYLHQMTPTLEPPSTASQQKASSQNMCLFSVSKIEGKVLEAKKKKMGLVQEENRKFKKRKKKQPNPLSCKKKKTKNELPKISEEGKVKRKRKRIKLAQHIKEAIVKDS